MSEKFRRLGKPIDVAEMDVIDTIEDIVNNGSAIYSETMWINNRDKRVMKVLEKPVLHDLTPVTGYGRGDTADQALVRALYTYAMQKPRPYVDPDEYPESSTSPLSINSDLTQLDYIVNDGDFRLFRQGHNIVAESTRDHQAGGGTYVGINRNVPDAVTNLADNYPFSYRGIRRLPITLLWDF